jgi:Spy/CpxP family protein refolding chaperone
MLKKLTISISIAVALAALALGQNPPAPPTPPDPQVMIQMRVSFLASYLTLTDAQKAGATSIYTNACTAGQTIQTNLQTSRQSLASAVKKNDTATIATLAATIGTLTGQLTAINSTADASFYALLTADQQTRYDAMPPGFGGGPGGPGGPGGAGAHFLRPPAQ